jgi:hypothetical protein
LNALSTASAQDADRARLTSEVDATVLGDAFPPVPLTLGLSGRAVLECAVAADGSSACAAAREQPEGFGFGAAAETLAREWRFTPAMENGRAAASVLRIPIVFENRSSQRLVLQTFIVVDGVRGMMGAIAENPGDGPNAEEVARLTCSWGGGTNCTRPDRNYIRRDQNIRFYPQAAREQNIDGRALVACAMRSNHRLDCAVEREAPEGWGFGERAVDLVTNIAEQGRDNITPGAAFRIVADFAMHDRGSSQATRSPWSSAPTGGAFMRYYPRDAMARNIDGRAVLYCEILPSRRLACVVGEESPVGYGFGEAAQRIAQDFVLSESAFGRPGYSVGERIRVPISFQIA